MAKMPKAQRSEAGDDVWVPTICWACVEGPCSIEVHRVNGVAVNVRGNRSMPDFERLTKNRGHLCPKGFGLIQKPYNPYRIKTPLKRTNPEKGIGVDPKWVEIGWDEALNIVGQKLKETRARDPGRVVVSTGPPIFGMSGTFWAFLPAYGNVNALRGGASIRCDMAEHNIANLIHGAFQCEPDLAYCKYLLLFGSNPSASGGCTENCQLGDAYSRGIKIVLIDPVLTVTGAKVDEWLPIKPGTDSAFLLALIDVIVNELGTWDGEFLKNMTNSPYLVGPDGYFVKDKTTDKVLIWDAVEDRAKAYDDDTIKDFALEGVYRVDGVECKPAFQMLKDHVRQYTPEWASQITDIPADTIRRIAREFVDNAMIGTTIKIGGLTLPYRPVATKIGRGITGVMRSYQCILANHILACLVGCLEVVGGHQGGRAEYEALYQRRQEAGRRYAGDGGIYPGRDGMKDVESFPWTWPPISYDGLATLVPFARIYGHMSHLAYRNLIEPPKNFPLPPGPEVLIAIGANNMTSVGEPEIVAEALRRIPFVVVLAYVENEMTQFADIVFPDRTELERFEPVYWHRSALGKKFYHGHQLRHPVIEPMHGIMDTTDMLTELAERIGMLDAYNEAINTWGALTNPYKLESGKKYDATDIMDRWCKSVTNGAHDLEWFKKNGGILEPTTVKEQYDVHLKMKALKLRYPVPYFEHVKRTGEELRRHLNEVGIDWWPTSEYVALPTYFPPILEEVPPEYDFYVTCARALVFGCGHNVDIPWLIEVAEHVRGQQDILMNADAAKARGIKDGDEVCVESEVGRVKHRVKLCQGIRPDTIVIAGQFGHPATPIARDTGWVTQTTLTPIRASWTDHVTSNMQATTVKAKVYKA